MKIIKNKAFRLSLYVIGFILVVLAFASGIASIFKYERFSDKENYNNPFETSNYVRDAVENSAEAIQGKAYNERQINEIDFLDTELEIYNYKDIKTSFDNDSDKVSSDKMTLRDILGVDNAVNLLSKYLYADGGSDTIYGAYQNMFDMDDNKYIRMTWQDYVEIVKDRCIKYSFEEDQFYNNNIGNDINDISEEKAAFYQKLSNSYPDMGISDGNYFTFIDDKLYMIDIDNNLIYYERYGYAQSLIGEKDYTYVYFPYKDITELKKLTDYDKVASFEDYILSSYILRSDIELGYSTLSDTQKSHLSHEVNQEYYLYDCNAAFSIDGKNIAYAYVPYDDILYCSEDGEYSVSYQELLEKFKHFSDIFVSYDAETGEVEQWYKDKNGDTVPYTYLNSGKMKQLTDRNNESFVIALNLSSFASSRIEDKIGYDLVKVVPNPLLVFVLSILVFLAVVIILILGGPKKLYLVDKAPYIVWLGIYFGVILLVAGIVGGVSYSLYNIASFINNEMFMCSVLTLMLLLVMYLTTAAVIMNLTRRVKCKEFLNGFVFVRLIKAIRRYISNNRDRFSGKKLAIVFLISFLFISLIGTLFFCQSSYDNFVAFVSLIMFVIDIVACIFVFKYLTDINKLLSISKRIESGELDAKINVNELTFNSREMGESLNNLGDGLSKAVEASIRDERTKAELITNVSHDIKTPLTSIINYVDLLKKEKIDNEKASEYINVLDQKSQRLKQLILDLIEASKTSTGNIELECMNLNLVELLNQGLGELEDKFKESGLEVVKTLQLDNAVIYADGRRVFRIIDNLLNNIIKYAQPNTRVFIDLKKFDSEESTDKVLISFKNVSKEMLNISPKELTERFVRGDRSRNTEGSGLGLSIAKNLVELQGGTFDISIDGDLFKVDIIFPLVK